MIITHRVGSLHPIVHHRLEQRLHLVGNVLHVHVARKNSGDATKDVIFADSVQSNGIPLQRPRCTVQQRQAVRHLRDSVGVLRRSVLQDGISRLEESQCQGTLSFVRIHRHGATDAMTQEMSLNGFAILSYLRRIIRMDTCLVQTAVLDKQNSVSHPEHDRSIHISTLKSLPTLKALSPQLYCHTGRRIDT